MWKFPSALGRRDYGYRNHSIDKSIIITYLHVLFRPILAAVCGCRELHCALCTHHWHMRFKIHSSLACSRACKIVRDERTVRPLDAFHRQSTLSRTSTVSELPDGRWCVWRQNHIAINRSGSSRVCGNGRWSAGAPVLRRRPKEVHKDERWVLLFLPGNFGCDEWQRCSVIHWWKAAEKHTRRIMHVAEKRKRNELNKHTTWRATGHWSKRHSISRIANWLTAN